MRFPSFEEVRALPCYLEREVPAEYEDANRHMNVTGYLRLHDQAAWPFMAALGLDAAYIAERRMSLFDLEHHLRYLDEMSVGDWAAVHGRMIERTDKLLHGQFFLLDLTNRRLSNTFEFLTAHVSLETRRTTPFPVEVAAAIDEVLEEHIRLGWAPPLNGVLGVRR